MFIRRTDAEAEVPVLWPPDVKNWLIGKYPDAGKDWRQEEKGRTEVGWHHPFYGHEFEQASGVGDGQGSLACRSPWHHKESDTTELLNWTDCQYSSECTAHYCLVHLATSWKINMKWTTRIDSLQKICLGIFFLSLCMLSIYAWN